MDEPDAADAATWYADRDGDGYGDPGLATAACTQPSGYVAGASDCDDADAGVNPAAAEVWYDGVDSDCDGASDYDADGDGHDSATYGGDDCDDADAATYPGAPDDPYDGVIHDCDDADEYDGDGDGHDAQAHGGDDCDDANSSIHPDQDEIWYDGVDQDCDGNDDDQDEDGWTVEDDCDDTDPDSYPGGPGLDEECNPLDTGTPDTGPEDSGLGGGDIKGGGGCDCASGGAPVGGLWVLALGPAAVSRRRAPR